MARREKASASLLAAPWRGFCWRLQRCPRTCGCYAGIEERHIPGDSIARLIGPLSNFHPVERFFAARLRLRHSETSIAVGAPDRAIHRSIPREATPSAKRSSAEVWRRLSARVPVEATSGNYARASRPRYLRAPSRCRHLRADAPKGKSEYKLLAPEPVFPGAPPPQY